MEQITESKLRAAFPKCKNPGAWALALMPALEKYGISTKPRIASFLGQIAHESGLFATLEENLSYSATRLMVVWPKRFPDLAFAKKYEKNPAKLAR